MKWLAWICLALLATPAAGQVFLVMDTARIPLLPDAASGGLGLMRFRIKTETDYALTASLISSVNNPQPGMQDQLLLQHALRHSWTITKPDRFTVTNSVLHRLGIQYFPDSLTRAHPDETLFITRMEYRLTKSTAVAFDSELSTRLFNSYNYLPDDSNQIRRVLISSFLTPLVWNMALGLTYKIPQTGSVALGISGLKLTCLRDTSVFSSLGETVFHGVKRGTNHLLEYGFSGRIQTDRTFWKSVHWNCDLLVFKGYNKPVDLVLRNLIELRLMKFLVISLQTRILYDEDISRRLGVENILSAGVAWKK